ncbi:MAG: hypothetical protein AAFZ15_14675 [Bacteroidota bacterium]
MSRLHKTDKLDFEKIVNLLNNRYRSSRLLPDEEMNENLARKPATRFRDTTVTNDYIVQLSINRVAKTEVEGRLYGSQKVLLL